MFDPLVNGQTTDAPTNIGRSTILNYRRDLAMTLKEKLPNQLFHLACLTLEEVIGQKGLNSILNFAKLNKFIGNYPPNDQELEHSSEDFTRLITGIVEIMGERGARVILFRAGMRSFQIMLEKFPSLFNLDGITPEERQPDRMFDEFVRIYKFVVDALIYIYGDVYKFYECEEGATLEISPCFWCTGLKTSEPVCSVPAGFEFAAARWILGQEIRVEETLCIAKGDPICKMVMYRP
jgi:predicted hydrocarbon binding protein